MNQPTLYESVARLAERTHAFSDADLEQPWAWRAHDEGARFALLGTYHELRDLAVALAHRRAQEGPSLTRAQRALAQVHAAYRDLQAILIGVTDEAYDQRPAPGEWPLRYVVGHIAGAERRFFTLVHYGVARQREGGDRPSRLPNDEVEKVTGSHEAFNDVMKNQGPDAMLALYDQLHQRTLSEFATISDEELEGPSLWWEGKEYSLEYRLHRFDAHSRQHAIQAEKTLAMIGHAPNEARRLLRLIYNALAEAESATIGAAELGLGQRQELAAAIIDRAEEVAAVVAQARAMVTAVQAGEVARMQSLLAENPKMANASSQNGLSAVLVAAYNGQKEALAALVEGGAELSIFEAATIGRFDRVKEHVAEWDGWINEHGRDGFTPLQLACFFGHEEIALWLIAQGADVEAVAQNQQRLRAVHAAAANGNLTVLKALLEKGADANAQQEGGFTPLHTAAGGSAPMAQLLLAHGADATLADNSGQKPLDLAIAKGNESVAAVLRKLE